MKDIKNQNALINNFLESRSKYMHTSWNKMSEHTLEIWLNSYIYIYLLSALEWTYVFAILAKHT